MSDVKEPRPLWELPSLSRWPRVVEISKASKLWEGNQEAVFLHDLHLNSCHQAPPLSSCPKSTKWPIVTWNVEDEESLFFGHVVLVNV